MTKKINNKYPDKLRKENKIEILDVYTGSNYQHKMQCMVCEHIWTATPKSKVQTLKKNGVSGCPNCTEKRKEKKYIISRADNILVLKSRGIIVLDDWDGRRHISPITRLNKVKVMNVECHHIFTCSPANLLANHVECAICGPQKRVEPLIQWSKANSAKWRETATEWEIYRNDVHKFTRDVYNKNKKKINPKNHPRGKAGTEGAYQLDHKVSVRFCFDNNIPSVVCADHTNLQMLPWRKNLSSKASIKGALPPLFLPYVESGKRIEKLATDLRDKVLPKAVLFKQMDDINITIYDEETSIGIVIIPLDKTYADMKIADISMKTMKENSIRPFIIFEDELNKDFIVNKLEHYIGKSSKDIPRIHGRKCNIVEISKKDKSLFLNKFHIQGNDAAQIVYGAYYDEVLVAVMTFTMPRVLLGYKERDRTKYNGIWELSRFATNTEYRIPGIAGKLLSKFKKDNKWYKIISYADKRWSVGNLYNVLGFDMEKSNKPDYIYIVNGKRRHRWNYRKDRLKETMKMYDPTLTEYQNMENAGYWRLWDCGTYRYVLYNE